MPCVRTFVLVLALLGCGLAFAQNPEEAASTADSILRDLDAQRRLPSQAQVVPSETKVIVERLPSRPPRDESQLPPSAPWSTVLKMLLWMSAICLVVFLIVDAINRFPEFRRRITGTSTNDDPSEVLPGTSAQADPLSSADTLAAAGCYSEAIHRLLVDLVAMLRRRLDIDIPDGLTSRELMNRMNLDDGGRVAFREIVFRVEHTWFGERAATSADYAAVRERFYLLAGPRKEAA